MNQPARERIRTVHLPTGGSVDETRWPIDLAIVALTGLVGWWTIDPRSFDVESFSWWESGYFRLGLLFALLVLALGVTRLLDRRVERRVQLCTIVSLLLHLGLFAALARAFLSSPSMPVPDAPAVAINIEPEGAFRGEDLPEDFEHPFEEVSPAEGSAQDVPKIRVSPLVPSAERFPTTPARPSLAEMPKVIPEDIEPLGVEDPIVSAPAPSPSRQRPSPDVPAPPQARVVPQKAPSSDSPVVSVARRSPNLSSPAIPAASPIELRPRDAQQVSELSGLDLAMRERNSSLDGEARSPAELQKKTRITNPQWTTVTNVPPPAKATGRAAAPVTSREVKPRLHPLRNLAVDDRTLTSRTDPSAQSFSPIAPDESQTLAQQQVTEFGGDARRASPLDRAAARLPDLGFSGKPAPPLVELPSEGMVASSRGAASDSVSPVTPTAFVEGISPIAPTFSVTARALGAADLAASASLRENGVRKALLNEGPFSAEDFPSGNGGDGSSLELGGGAASPPMRRAFAPGAPGGVVASTSGPPGEQEGGSEIPAGVTGESVGAVGPLSGGLSAEVRAPRPSGGGPSAIPGDELSGLLDSSFASAKKGLDGTGGEFLSEWGDALRAQPGASDEGAESMVGGATAPPKLAGRGIGPITPIAEALAGIGPPPVGGDSGASASEGDGSVDSTAENLAESLRGGDLMSPPGWRPARVGPGNASPLAIGLGRENYGLQGEAYLPDVPRGGLGDSLAAVGRPTPGSLSGKVPARLVDPPPGSAPEPQTGFAQRDPATRGERAKRFGGSDQTEAAVERGLEFLAAYQFPDGRWRFDAVPDGREAFPELGTFSYRADTAATALALLAFLGAGYTHFEGKHSEVVAKGLGWLLSQQQPDGAIFAEATEPTRGPRMYAHGFAALALCEAYGITGDPALRGPAEAAVRFILSAQDPVRGGWRYTKHPDQPTWIKESDTSVSGWQLLALQSARLAGLSVPQDPFAKAAKWLDTAAVDGGARYCYSPFVKPAPEAPAPHQANLAMTAEGLLMRLILGWKPNSAAFAEGVRYLQTSLPTIDDRQPGARDAYYWYYATQVMFHSQGKAWEVWNEAMQKVLIPTQLKDGPWAGSWDPLRPTRDRWAHAGGRIYVTCLHVLMLEVYYRYLPIFGLGTLDGTAPR